MGATLYPQDFKRKQIDEAVNPFPIPEITPPDTKINLVVFFVSGTIYIIKKAKTCQREKIISYLPQQLRPSPKFLACLLLELFYPIL